MTSEDLQRLWQVVVVVGAIAVGIGGYFSYHYGKKVDAEREARAAQAGRLVPEPQKPPPRRAEFPELEIGDSGAVFLWAGPGGTPMFQFANDNQLTISSNERGLVRVSTLIRDKSGAIVAELVENEWRVKRERAWDRNYNASALEVKDATGDVVLQVRLVTPSRVQFQAKLYDKSGNGVAIGKGRGRDGTMGGVIEQTGSAHPELTMKIEPIFRYPSDQHFGELAKPSK